MVRLPPDFKEFLRLLNGYHADYLVVGGYAVSAHGYPRHTGDLDLWIRTSQRNADKVLKACREFGIDVPKLRRELFLTPTQLTRLGHPPCRIEIMNSVSGLRFSAAWRNRIIWEVDGLLVPMVSLADLRTNKQASGRLKDLADLEQLPLPPSPPTD